MTRDARRACLCVCVLQCPTKTHAATRTRVHARARARTQIIDVVWAGCVADHDGTFEFPRAAMCEHRYADCGPGRLNRDGSPNPCHLRHRDSIPLTALRPPVLVGDFAARDVSESRDAPLRLQLTPGALQQATTVLEDDIQLGLYVN